MHNDPAGHALAQSNPGVLDVDNQVASHLRDDGYRAAYHKTQALQKALGFILSVDLFYRGRFGRMVKKSMANHGHSSSVRMANHSWELSWLVMTNLFCMCSLPLLTPLVNNF